MSKQKNYRNLLEVLMEGEKENRDLQDYICEILPEKASDSKYIEKLYCRVCDIYDAIDMDIDKYWIANNYINMLREVKIF